VYEPLSLCGCQPVWLDFTATLLFPSLYMALLFLLHRQGKLPYVFMSGFTMWYLLAFVATLMALATAAYRGYSAVRAWRWKEAREEREKVQ
jgi:hypothetical protein